jgi:hypothetical protein
MPGHHNGTCSGQHLVHLTVHPGKMYDVHIISSYPNHSENAVEHIFVIIGGGTHTQILNVLKGHFFVKSATFLANQPILQQISQFFSKSAIY